MIPLTIAYRYGGFIQESMTDQIAGRSFTAKLNINGTVVKAIDATPAEINRTFREMVRELLDDDATILFVECVRENVVVFWFGLIWCANGRFAKSLYSRGYLCISPLSYGLYHIKSSG
ncbi:hypothetical protein Hanom_Chr16g01450691 [Helianthus anomalus]